MARETAPMRDAMRSRVRECTVGAVAASSAPFFSPFFAFDLFRGTALSGTLAVAVPLLLAITLFCCLWVAAQPPPAEPTAEDSAAAAAGSAEGGGKVELQRSALTEGSAPNSPTRSTEI